MSTVLVVHCVQTVGEREDQVAESSLLHIIRKTDGLFSSLPYCYHTCSTTVNPEELYVRVIYITYVSELAGPEIQFNVYILQPSFLKHRFCSKTICVHFTETSTHNETPDYLVKIKWLNLLYFILFSVCI